MCEYPLIKVSSGINNFLTAKDYLFNELYDKEKIKKNEIYKINSLLEAIDLFSKCPELLRKISATNQKLTKEDKKNLLEFRQSSCNNHTINSLEELNVEVQKVYNSYIDKINEYECMRHIIDAGLLNPGFEDANSYKEKFNLEEDKL